MSERLDRLRDVLLVQCAATETHAALSVADRSGAGVVVSTRRRHEVLAFADLAVKRATPLLVDAAHYTGATRRLASERFDPSWLRVQREAELPVLSDSGYVGEQDRAGLDSVLGQARAHGDVIAVLPLASWWLDRARGLPHLLDRVHAADVPIAVVLEHRDDPLGVARTLGGLLALLRVGVPVVQLRCDISGLGLICHGAHSAAVGTQTRLRHLYPIPTTSGGPGRQASIATIVPECLSFVAIEKIAFAVAADPDDSLWAACICPACKGRQLDAIARAPMVERSAWAFEHALHTLFDLRDHLVAGGVDETARQVSWREHCGSALVRYSELADAGQHWRVPPFLRRWFEIPTRARAV